MSYNYAVTAYKATAVTAVLTGNFTGENELNLILVKGSNLVVNVVTPEGLKSVVDVNIRGRISLAKLIRPAVSSLFVDLLLKHTFSTNIQHSIVQWFHTLCVIGNSA